MVNLNTRLVDAAKKSTHEQRKQGEGDGGDSAVTKTHGILSQRIQAANELSKGERVKKVQYKVDPGRCRMWENHNRDYQLLNEIRCADLVEGFKSMGKQEFAAIVRRVENDPNYDYEVICGARRHWTATYLGWSLLIEVRELTDEEAFRLADIENRDRADISDFERATDYRHALKEYYQSQKQMAERLEVTVDWLSRFLALAELPSEIVKAYRDVTEIRIQHGRELAKGLKDAKARQRILARAKELHGQGLEGQQVITQLKQAMSLASKKGEPLAQYKAKNGKSALTVNKKGRGLVLQVEPGSGADKREILDLIGMAIEEHYQ